MRARRLPPVPAVEVFADFPPAAGITAAVALFIRADRAMVKMASATNVKIWLPQAKIMFSVLDTVQT
jgi:hypothetical protein